MIDPKLTEITKALDEWCQSHDILYDIVCDESDLQGIMLFKKDTVLLAGLLNELAPIIQEQGVYAQIQKVRGGNILAFSIRAISESVMSRMINKSGQTPEPYTFAERIEQAFLFIPTTQADPPPPEVDFYASAKRIVEAQYKYATAGSFRNNQSSRQRQALTHDTTFSGREHPSSPNKKKKAKFEARVAEALELPITDTANDFNRSLREALNGIATPTGQQPQDLFAKFSRALKVLGDQLGVGPLQDRLKEQGIQWKKSDDAQSIILYIVNASTNAPQPIARVSAETLENPSDFEEQLTHMLDFAQGDAPGAFKQKQDQIKNQERAVRDIAKAVSPQDQEGEVAKQMNADLTAEQGAAQTAAAPKPTAQLNQPAAPQANPAVQQANPQRAELAKRLTAPRQSAASF